MISIKAFSFNPFQENTFVLWDEDLKCVLVDPSPYTSEEVALLERYILSGKLSPKAVWLTHGHFDHIFGVSFLARKYALPVLMHPGDKLILAQDEEFAAGVGLRAPEMDFETEDIHDGQVLALLKGSPFTVMETPGHTPGSVCFYDETDKVMFSGDTLFAGAIGRTDHPGGDYDKEIVSIMEKLMGLPGDVDVLPGHGPRTSIGRERADNPFLQPFNEPGEGMDWNPEEM